MPPLIRGGGIINYENVEMKFSIYDTGILAGYPYLEYVYSGKIGVSAQP